MTAERSTAPIPATPAANVAGVADIVRRFVLDLPECVTGRIVGGDPADGEGQRWTICYPGTGKPVTQVQGTSLAGVDGAVKAARRAFDDGPWRRMATAERNAALYRCSDVINAHGEELAALQSLEAGLSFSHGTGMHVPRSAENFRFFADIMTGLAGQTYEQTGNFVSMVTHVPIGVGAVIAPWNAPLALASMKMAACLALGNSCILKPSENTPLALTRMVELLNAHVLPEGVLQIVHGHGADIGAALVGHPGVNAVGFIGGTGTGKRIMASAAQNLTKVGLELGGKSANIICESADLERAIDGALVSIFANNGQQCLAGSRILVQRSIADRFIPAFTERAANLRLGDPFDPATELGPIAFKAHMDRILGYADAARADGDAVLTGGRRADGFGDGFYMEPTVVQARSNATRVCQEEIFGPFAALLTFDTLEEAIAIANDSPFGLVGYIWSDHLPTVMHLSDALETGTIWVNTTMVRDLRAPFGGVKQSGIGRDGLPGSLELFWEEKSIMLPKVPVRLPRIGLGVSNPSTGEGDKA